MSTTVRAALRDVALFSELSEEELAVLAEQVVEGHYGRNEIIFSEGDVGDGLYIVTDGHVSISRQGEDGDELILSVNEAGEYFGDLALFDSEPRSASASAIDDCTLLFLSRSAFREFLRLHPSAVFTCLEVIVRRLRSLTDLADEIALLDVRSRLARRLLRLAEQGVVATGEGAEPGAGSSLRITQQQLASMTGATRESINKHLNSFADEGVIRLEHGRIRIFDVQRLKRYSAGLV
jgi:CRP-like cAMP-binding protein